MMSANCSQLSFGNHDQHTASPQLKKKAGRSVTIKRCGASGDSLQQQPHVALSADLEPSQWHSAVPTGGFGRIHHMSRSPCFQT